MPSSVLKQGKRTSNNRNSSQEFDQDCETSSNLRSPLPGTVSVSSNGSTVSRSADRGRKTGSSLSWGTLNFGTAMTSDLYTLQFPGALPFESIIYAWYFAQSLWHSATIILARLSTSNESQIVPSRRTEDYVSKIPSFAVYPWPNDVFLYDYYIHFHGEDRRHDVWIEAGLLRPSTYIFHSTEQYKYQEPGPDEIHRNMDIEYLREHEENTKLKTIGRVCIGNYYVDSWYFSPFPIEFQNISTLYICKFCLHFFKHASELKYHSVICPYVGPPGDYIYIDDEKGVVLFEVDGAESKAYAENLCFLSKLFLDHKTLRHPVYLFLFYVLGEIHSDGINVVGYFSKEKYSKNNLSCIMCLPQHQRKGYGQFLVNMSYALSWKEGKRGTPERPLSDLGRAAYMKYWSQAALDVLLSKEGEDCEISIEEISEETSIEPVDLVSALQTIGVLVSFKGIFFFFLPTEYDTAEMKCSKKSFSACPVSDNSFNTINKLLEHVNNGHQQKIQDKKGSVKKRRRESTTTGVKDNSKKKKIQGKKNVGSVNLSLLQWEPYDLHLAPYEYAPTVL